MKITRTGPFDLWIQASSGGEALLTNMILKELSTSVPQGQKLKILATSGTSQGIDTLIKGQKEVELSPMLKVDICFFPFDAPFLMKKAFQRFSPAMAIVIETELWPGFLIAAQKNNVPVIIVNGRMTEKSYHSYKYAHSFFKKYGPEKVLAISADDRDRFAQLIGDHKTTLMNNIKFDRLTEQDSYPVPPPISEIVAGKSPLVIFGSIRREEEQKVLYTIAKIHTEKPEVTIGIFPKHIERADAWQRLLEQKGIASVKRSMASGYQPSGSVIVWDNFGELSGAYTIAKAAFVGGSLVNLGGQNFLEPLISGLRPSIGPYWKNFSWVGNEIFSTRLVNQVQNEQELAEQLLSALNRQEDRNNIIKEAQAFFAPKKGGTLQACSAITEKLKTINRI